MDDIDKKIADLEAEIEDLKKRLPAHSVQPRMIIELEDLEEALEQALQQRKAK